VTIQDDENFQHHIFYFTLDKLRMNSDDNMFARKSNHICPSSAIISFTM